MPKILDRNVEIIPEHEVIRSINSNKGSYIPWLGAGTSVEAGIKSGSQICVELRKQLAAYAKPVDEAAWAKNELAWDDPKRRYSTCLKKYGSPARRVRYFRELIQGLQPCFSHHAVALLMDSGFFARTCLTTNFDKLTELAFAQQGQTECQAIRGDEEASFWRREDDKSYIIKLHGDYDTHNLLNTTDETVRIPTNLQRIVFDLVKQRGLIVVGSSGYEESVIRLLGDLLDDADATILNMGLYWGVNAGAPPRSPLPWRDTEEIVSSKIQRGSVSRDLLDLMDVMRKKGFEVPRAFFPVFGAGHFFQNVVDATDNKALSGRASRYLDHKMRLRLRFSSGGLTPAAVELRIARLDDKEEDRRSIRQFEQRSRPNVKIWTAVSDGRRQQVDVTYGDITSRSLMGSPALGPGRRGIVSPEDTLISAGGGVALALLKKAGQHALLNELSKFRHVEHRDVVVTSGGELPVAYIFHAAATLLQPDGTSAITPADITASIKTALNVATVLDVTVLFVPLIGAGLEGINPCTSLEAILQGIQSVDRLPQHPAVHVCIVIREEGTISRQDVGKCMQATLAPDFQLQSHYAAGAIPAGGTTPSR